MNEDKIRCFICIKMPDEVIKEVANVQEKIEKRNFTGKTTELGNLHLTLKFLGEIDNNSIEKVKNELDKIHFNNLQLHLGKIGFFKVRGTIKIIWVKIEGKDIWDIQAKIDESLKEIFPKEERFMSHMTVARIKYYLDRGNFENYISGLKVKNIKFEIDRFYLMSSELSRTGPVYKIIKEFTIKS